MAVQSRYLISSKLFASLVLSNEHIRSNLWKKITINNFEIIVIKKKCSSNCVNKIFGEKFEIIKLF